MIELGKEPQYIYLQYKPQRTAAQPVASFAGDK